METVGLVFVSVISIEVVEDGLCCLLASNSVQVGWRVLWVAVPALSLRALGAILAGRLLVALHPAVFVALSAGGLAFTGLRLLLKRTGNALAEPRSQALDLKGALWLFVAILTSELVDPSQLLVASLGARGTLHAVWLGATLAMAVKAVVAVAVGTVAGRIVPLRLARLVGACTCFAAAAWTIIEVIAGERGGAIAMRGIH